MEPGRSNRMMDFVAASFGPDDPGNQHKVIN
jgi:hypothetical protein